LLSESDVEQILEAREKEKNTHTGRNKYTPVQPIKRNLSKGHLEN